MVINHDFLVDPSHRVLGSFKTWLIVLDSTGEIICRDSTSSAQVHLPPLAEFPDVERVHVSEDQKSYYRISNQYGYPQNLSPKQMIDWYVKKIILSSSPANGADYIAFAVIQSGSQVAYCKRGDTQWRCIPLSFTPDAHRSTEDVVYYNGLLVALSCNEICGDKEFTICDLTGPNPTSMVVQHAQMCDIFSVLNNISLPNKNFM